MERLDKQKIHAQESCTDMTDRLADMAVDDEPLSDETVRAIESSREDIRIGRIYTLEQVMADLKEE